MFWLVPLADNVYTGIIILSRPGLRETRGETPRVYLPAMMQLSFFMIDREYVMWSKKIQQ